jgi:hypothetical protein
MRSVRTLLVGTMLVALTTLAACGGGSGSSTEATASQGGGGASTGASSGGEPTEPAAATPTENPGGGGGGDVDSMVSALTPPNATQISRTDAGGGVINTRDSSDSVDSLKSFYEGKIPSTGMHVISTTNAGGYYSWVFAESDSSSHGGSVTLGPSSTGGSGTSVVLAFTTQ